MSRIYNLPLHRAGNSYTQSAMHYTWDPAKDAKNLAKHGVAFAAVAAGFEWEHALVIADLRSDEPRLTALAPIGSRLFYLVFTIERRSVRVISFRKASNKEKALYAATP